VEQVYVVCFQKQVPEVQASHRALDVQRYVFVLQVSKLSLDLALFLPLLLLFQWIQGDSPDLEKPVAHTAEVLHLRLVVFSLLCVQVHLVVLLS